MSYRSASSRAAAFDQALREAMGSSVTKRFNVEGAPAADPSAGTPSPEGVAVDAVAADPAVTDPRSKSYDGDRVKHYPTLGVTDCTGDPWVAARLAEHEHIRKARLRRWQAVDPRERKG